MVASRYSTTSSDAKGVPSSVCDGEDTRRRSARCVTTHRAVRTSFGGGNAPVGLGESQGAGHGASAGDGGRSLETGGRRATVAVAQKEHGNGSAPRFASIGRAREPGRHGM